MAIAEYSLQKSRLETAAGLVLRMTSMKVKGSVYYVPYVMHVELYGTASCTWPQKKKKGG